MVKVLDGKFFAEEIRKEVAREVEELKKRAITPGLAVIIVGENAASKLYVKKKHEACGKVGIYSEVIRLPENTTEAELLARVEELNANKRINGILVQLPLPKHIDENKVIDQIDPDKDVDGFHPLNVGDLVIGKNRLVPCTPHGCIKMLELAGINPEGKKAVVIGRSNIVGKPMFHLLLQKNATVTIAHSKTRNLQEICRDADIVVAAIGKPKFVTRDFIKPGAVLIDVGINKLDGKTVGDVDFADCKDVAGAISPVPGGVGPLTIVMLLYNTIKAAKIQNQCK
ncbi:MAG TPA: bifunctional methylenetetrahydrofolate dehydrogenase/methenyltetrahydrofolate cyclohydrolase FolD [Negativicutes bacterium]|nr:bifunctional methylenetetrahydrofolate dehydrogenase/methenyltetrahydrofolate cyclohydrolase FolD [Negativicutes bacterium]